MPFIEQLGMQAAQGALGAGMGMILGAHDRAQQIKQQRKLQDMQIQGQMQMGRFNQQQALEMWDKTNYYAQMQQLKKAGLNPGLIYGMGGAGGAIANATPGQVTGAQANPSTPAAGMGMQMGSMQLQLLHAQKKNIEANTGLTNAQKDKTTGVDTALGEQTIEKLKQDISSSKTQQALTEVETAIASIREAVAGATQNMEIAKIAAATKIITNDATISDATRDTAITTIKRESLQVYLENELLKSEKILTDEQTNKTRQEIKNLIQQITASQKQMQLEDLKTRIMENESFRAAQEAGMINLDELTRNIGILLPISGAKGHTPIRGLHDRR